MTELTFELFNSIIQTSFDRLFTVIGILFTVCFGLFLLAINFLRNIEKSTNTMEKLVTTRFWEERSKLVEHYKAREEEIEKLKPKKKNNPSSEKDYLLDRLKYGTITYNELLTLKKILEEEERAAKNAGAVGVVLIIAGILALIGAAIIAMDRE